MDNKFLVPIETIQKLKDYGCHFDNPTYHEVIDWIEKDYNIYMECNIWINDDKKLIYWVHIFTPDEDFGTDYYQSREDAYNAAFTLLIEENLLN